MIGDGSDRGPVALPVFKTGCCLLAGQAGFDSQTLPPLALRVASTRLVVRRGRLALRACRTGHDSDDRPTLALRVASTRLVVRHGRLALRACRTGHDSRIVRIALRVASKRLVGRRGRLALRARRTGHDSEAFRPRFASGVEAPGRQARPPRLAGSSDRARLPFHASKRRFCLPRLRFASAKRHLPLRAEGAPTRRAARHGLRPLGVRTGHDSETTRPIASSPEPTRRRRAASAYRKPAYAAPAAPTLRVSEAPSSPTRQRRAHPKACCFCLPRNRPTRRQPRQRFASAKRHLSPRAEGAPSRRSPFLHRRAPSAATAGVPTSAGDIASV